jgi:hypothetical protein
MEKAFSPTSSLYWVVIDIVQIGSNLFSAAMLSHNTSFRICTESTCNNRANESQNSTQISASCPPGPESARSASSIGGKIGVRAGHHHPLDCRRRASDDEKADSCLGPSTILSQLDRGLIASFCWGRSWRASNWSFPALIEHASHCPKAHEMNCS